MSESSDARKATPCRRLEEDLLGELGGALDPHVEQCPDCSARVHGYRRIAGWIADGRTMHAPSADWRQRTLASVLADGGRLRSIPSPPTGPEPAASANAATELPPKPPGTLADSGSSRGQSPSRRPRRRWARAVIPIAGAAIAIAVVVVVMRAGDSQPSRVAINTPGTASGELTRFPPDHAGSTVPSGPSPDVHESGTRPGTEAPAPPTKVPAAGDAQGDSKQPPSTRHPGDRSQPETPAVPSTKRGGEVVVDWGRDGSASAPDAPGAVHVAFDPPTGDFGGFAADEVQRVIEARTGLYRACYLTELARAPTLRGKLVVRIQIAGDGRVQAVDSLASSASTLHNDAVAQCVIGHMKGLLFPANGRTADVTSTFELSRGD